MNPLDIRTVIFSQLITNALCTFVLLALWRQNRNRYAGLAFWVIDLIFQTGSSLLIVLRGSIPDWVSIGLSSPLAIAGALMGLFGLQRFLKKKESWVHNFTIFLIFCIVHFYFFINHPNLDARDINVSAGLFLICFQCAWLMLWRERHDRSQGTRTVGWVFAIFCLISAIRVFILGVHPLSSNDFLQSGLYETLILMSYQILLILFSFGLVLLVNRRLLIEVKTQEEKITKAFHLSPYAILISRLSDGLILDVNRGFEKITGFQSSAAIGKTTLDLPLWVKETDCQQVVDELSTKGEVEGREYQFQSKTNGQWTGMFFAEILSTENERLVLSTISDITERKQAEERLIFQSNLLANISDIVYATDLQLHIIAWNLAAERMYGWNEAEVLGMPILEVVRSKFDPALRSKLVDDLIHQESVMVVVEHISKTGDSVFFESHTSILRNVNGEMIGYISVNHDITDRKRAEEALRNSERLYRAIGESIDYGVWVCAPDGRNIYASDSYLKLVGITQEDCSNFGWGDTLHPDDAERTMAAWKECTRTGGNWDIEHRFRGVDGKWHPILARGVPIRNENGEITAWAGINLDISQLKQSQAALQTALDRFQLIFDSNIIGMLTAKANGSIVEANDYYLDMLGYSRAELLAGKIRWDEITPPEFLYLDQNCLLELNQKGTSTPYEKQYIRKDGSRIWVYLVDTLLPGPEGEIAAFCLDISARKSLENSLAIERDELHHTNDRLALELIERKKVEDTIQHLNEALEIRVQERTYQLEVANKELEAFSYSVSHDLRAPLRGIDGWGLALMEDYNERLDDKGRLYLERVRSETRRMAQLIDDLLQLSRITRVEMQKGPVDLTGLAQTIVTRLQTAEPVRQVKVEIQPGLTAWGDTALLGVVLTNLLDNAWKFTSKKTDACIDFGQVEKDGRAAFYIRDNGAGFDMTYVQKLFGAFQRLHKASEFSGTGIGLATVQRIIHRHGGEIWAEGLVDQGAAFFFTLGENI